MLITFAQKKQMNMSYFENRNSNEILNETLKNQHTN